MSAAESAPKQRGRPFRPGQSGNPAGRPKGARNKATILAEALHEQEAVAKAQALVDRALAGNVAAMRAFLNRVAPVEHDMVHLDLTELRTLSDIVDASTSLIAGVTAGEIGLGEAKRVMKRLVTHQTRLAVRSEESAMDTGENSGQGTGASAPAADCPPPVAAPNSELAGQIQRAAPSNPVRSAESESESAPLAPSQVTPTPGAGTQRPIHTADPRHRSRPRRTYALAWSPWRRSLLIQRKYSGSGSAARRSRPPFAPALAF